MRPPVHLLAAAGLTLTAPAPGLREGHGWLVEWRGERGLLRQTGLPAGGTAATRTREDVAWLHGFLAALGATGFPAPRPLPAFDGKSWTISYGSLWQLVTFLPGQVVGWEPAPSMTEIGVLMAAYHDAAGAVAPRDQRPAALPLGDVPDILLSSQVEGAGVGREQAATIRKLAAGLAADLARSDVASAGRLVIHGDFTCHNVVAGGRPPVVLGVIDFELAHVESSLADLGYGLWRSGRAYQQACHLDATRVRQFLRGYTSVRPLSAEQASLVPVYLRGRGLQMIAKRIRAGRPETGMLAQVSWLSAHHDAVAEIIAAAC